MIFIDRDMVPVPLVFSSKKMEIAIERIKDFYKRPRESRRQEKFIKPFDQELKLELFGPLRMLFNGKCAYCESEISGEVVNPYDHFRPKNGARGFDKEFSDEHYWWLTYEWRNIYHSCKVCGRYKSTWFPVNGRRAKVNSSYEKILKDEIALLIDPCNDRPEEHLIFKENGEVDFLTEKGNATIEIFKLNRADLVEARLNVLKDLFGVWEEFNKKRRAGASNSTRLREIISDWRSILDTTSSRSYLAAQQQVLSKWINNRPDIQEFFIGEYSFQGADRGVNVDFISNLNISEVLQDEQKQNIVESLKMEEIKHVYLEKIEMLNFKCFSHLEIKFNDVVDAKAESENGLSISSEPWLLFLGENGVGKSSILKAIAIALMGGDYAKMLGEKISIQRLLKHGADEGYVKLYLKGRKEPIEIHLKRGKELECSHQEPVSYLVGYGAIRLLPNKKIQPEKGNFQTVKTENLFDYSIALTDATNWLLGLNNKDFDLAAIALKDLMLLDQSDRLSRDKLTKKVLVVKGIDPPISIEELSDGYQAVFAIAVDIMATLASEKVRYDLAEGIVLIDEIGTHLHPRWKMEVVRKLRACFPRIQFIVTTHEPLCLRGLRAGETVVLIRDSDKEITAVTDLPDPSELRVDQILTSEFFGLKSTIDPATEAIFDEYYSILAIAESDRTDVQKNRLLLLSESIPKMKHLGDSLREELVYYVIDELLAKKSKAEGPRVREELKKEAINRVESLWNML
jgi:uncharacterized protein (TIGR02646 family)